MTAFYRRICPQWCWLYLLFARWDRFPILAEVVDCVFDGGGFVSLDILLYPFFLALWFLCWSSWCPPGLTPVGWLSNLFTNWAMWKQNFPSLFWWCQRLKSRINSQTSFKNQRVVQSIIKIQVKIQKETQDIQELQEKHQDKYKKIFFKRKDWIAQFAQKNFSKKNLLPKFLLSGNRLPEGSNRLPEAQTVL